jgi:adenylate cyclase
MSEPGPAAEASAGWRPSLGAVLTATLLVAVLATAAFVHFSWSAIARGNVRDLVDQLNDRIAASIRQEVGDVIADAGAAQEALRTIFFQNVIKTNDEAKREFVFLALLQSQPSLSWISFGWPDGNFFGAQKVGDDRIQMVEVKWNADRSAAERRVDYYDIITGDIEFKERAFEPSDYDATAQGWYKRALAANGPIWSDVALFPTSNKPAIATSGQLVVFQQFQGVINIVIELERLSRFLATIPVGRSGTVVIVDRSGRIVASPELAEGTHAETAEMPMLGADKDKLEMVAKAALTHFGMRLAEIEATMPLAFRSDLDRQDYIVTFTPLGFKGWLIATVVPESDFLAQVERSTQRLVWWVLGFTIAIALLATLFARLLIARPLGRVAAELAHIESFELGRITRRRSPLREIDRLSAALAHMASGLASFQKYLPTELVRTLVRQGIEAKPGGSHQPITVMFTDLVGFTRLSERLGDAVVPILADYLGRMSGAIHGTGGTIDKFIGDAIMAFWGAPIANPVHARDACRAAVACDRILAAMREAAKAAGGEELHMRVGINSGKILVGNIGSTERLNYTAIGDAVNVASRLEGLNKRYGTRMLIGAATREAAGEAIVVRRLDRVAVFGRTEGLAMYELVGLAEERDQLGPLDWIALYEAGLDRYAARRFAEAEAAFAAADRARPGGDPAARTFIEAARRFKVEPPPADWQAVTIMDEK